MKLGNKLTAIILLFVGLVLVNYLASSLPFRFDATAENIYTLSPGTKSILSKIEEPIQLDYYFSSSVEGVPVQFKNYAARVQEMLRQYVRASHGKLQLNVINPKPDSPEEERATSAGLTPQRLPSGDRLDFGLIAIQADQQKVIASFNPQREQFLEYDISQLIYSVQQVVKKKLGLLTSLPLRGTPDMPMMRQRGRPSQFVITEWEKSYEIVDIQPSATELPANLDALAVIHPQNLSPKLQYAIDQFILQGKPAFIAVDPVSQYFKQAGGQQAMFGGPQPNVSSDLPRLFNAYGIHYNPQLLIGDMENATQVSTGPGSTVNYPIWLSLIKDSFNAKAMPTAQLNSLLLVEAGSIDVPASTGLTVTPLIQSSSSSGDIQAMIAGMAPPEDLARQITPSGRKTIAALIQGKLHSAFPDGEPAEEKPPGDKKPDDKKPEVKPAAAGLKESKATSTLIVVADTDWLFDDYTFDPSYQRAGLYVPRNDNYALGSNSLDYLSGSQDLISIRGKGSSIRQFAVVKAMEVAAQRKYQEQLTALDNRLNDVQKKLTELQGKKTEGNRLIASPEIAKTIDEFQKQEASMRSERRKIRKALREDIEALGNRLLVINLVCSPLLVVGFGLWFYRHRRQ